MVEFVAAGSPRAVSRAIEEYASGQRVLSAIVVPWESDRVTLSMSVTAVSGEGWAIEHTNLGTIRLTDLGNEHTQVTVSPDRGHPTDEETRTTLFNRFAEAVHSRFAAAP